MGQFIAAAKHPAAGVRSHGASGCCRSKMCIRDRVKGKTLEQALTIKNTAIAEELALPPVKIHCSILAEDAIKAAVDDYKKKHAH